MISNCSASLSKQLQIVCIAKLLSFKNDKLSADMRLYRCKCKFQLSIQAAGAGTAITVIVLKTSSNFDEGYILHSLFYKYHVQELVQMRIGASISSKRIQDYR